MIDGVKVRCLGIDAKDWEENSLLVFNSGIDIQTGELLGNGRKIAFYKGLTFHLIPSTLSDTLHCYIKGSLAKYYTDGKTNAFDFNVSMLSWVLHDLSYKFHFNPANAVLENLEYGININLPIDPKKVIRGLIAYKSKGFKTFSIDNTNLGQCIGSPTYQTIKIYDKSKQDPQAPKNLLRMEIAVKRMSIVSKYGIKTLQDLTAPKVAPLLYHLLEVWNDCIYVDEKRKYREMTSFERSKWLFYINPKKWEDLEKKQRYRMKKHFTQLKAKYGMNDTQQEIANLINSKIKELTAETDIYCVHLLHNFSTGFESPKTNKGCPPFTRLDKGVKGTPNTTLKPKRKAKRKTAKKCTVCNKDISAKKAGSKFCSKHCNNSYHASRRTTKRRERILGEKKQLAILLQELGTTDNWCLISYRVLGEDYSDILHQREICFKGMVWKNVYQVWISSTANFKTKNILTSYRARKYIQMLNRINTP